MSRRYAPGDSAEPVSVPTFSAVVATFRASRKRAGLPYDRATLHAEASAYFARLVALTPAEREERARLADHPP